MQRFASLINTVLANGRGNVIRCLLQLRMPIAHSHTNACGSHDLIIIHTVAKGDRVLQRDIPGFAEAFEAFCLGGILFNDIGPLPGWKTVEASA